MALALKTWLFPPTPNEMSTTLGMRRRLSLKECEKNYGNGQDTHFCINMHRTHIFSFGRPDFQPGPQTYNTSA